MSKKDLDKLSSLDFNNPETKKEYNDRLFSVVAPRYNTITRVLSFWRDGAWKSLLMRELPSEGALNCLDLACGTGDITLALAGRYEEGRVKGLDLNREMMAIAELKAASSENIEFTLADMCSTGEADESYDIITGGYALRNAPDIRIALKEIHRLLKPGGRCAFLDFSKSPSRGISAVHLALLKFWGSLWGLIFHGNSDVYAYIAESLRNFPDRREIKRLIKEAGFTKIYSRVLLFGFIELLFFEKGS